MTVHSAGACSLEQATEKRNCYVKKKINYSSFIMINAYTCVGPYIALSGSEYIAIPFMHGYRI